MAYIHLAERMAADETIHGRAFNFSANFRMNSMEMIGAIYRVAWFATRANYWRFTTNAGAVVNLAADVTRSPAYLGPQ